MRILFCCNTLHGFCNFRLDVVKHLIGKGNEAVILYPYMKGDEMTVTSLPMGCRAIVCRMSPNGKSVFQDAGYLLRLLSIFRQENPDLVINYTVKPNIYGGLAAKLRKVPSISVVPGLGYVFSKKGVIGSLLRRFYIWGLRLAQSVFVLNSSDRDSLMDAGLDKERIVLLKGGEGVNLTRFPFYEGSFLHPRFLMVSRLLYDKGYREFVAVARRVSALYPNIRFEIAGTINEQNPSGVPLKEVETDEQSGCIRYLGYIENINKELSEPNTIVVLPSYYREGMNRSLMEACSCGRPIITTNLPGLRELVVDGENGFLVEPGDVDSLFEKIVAFIDLPIAKRIQMGHKSRELAESRFDIKDVQNVYDKTIEKIIVSPNV